MRTRICLLSLRDSLFQFLTPDVWKQGHRAWQPGYTSPRWTLQSLVWVLLTMACCCANSQEERFATARAAYIACHQKIRRPGETLAGFLTALSKLPLFVLRALANAVRRQLGRHFVEPARIHGFVPFACDGTRLECPRAESLQQRLDQAGKPQSAPMVYLTTLVLLPLGLLWSWRLGKGTADEHNHLRRLLPTLPVRSLVVGDALYLGYDMFAALLKANVSFLVRMSSRTFLYTEAKVRLKRFREGRVYYWPQHPRDRSDPPIPARLLRLPGKKADVWLLTNVLDRKQLSRKTAAQLYRWRWLNEGLFRTYKRMLAKTKLQSRTVALIHREAEGSLLALQLLLALGTHEAADGQRGQATVPRNSPRRVLLRIRGAVQAAVRSLGSRQFATYRQMLQKVRCPIGKRTYGKIRQAWPRQKPYKPPGPPELRVLGTKLKAKVKILLGAA